MAKIDALLEEVLRRGATDLHLSAGCPPHVRVRGKLTPVGEAVLDRGELDAMLMELLTPRTLERLDLGHDVEFSVAYKDAARFRASYFQKAGGLGAVFRFVPPRVPSLAELGCPESLWKLADRRSGLVLVAGPRSSGKSTTTAAMLDHINKTRPCHVLTIEDPIELVHAPLRAQITQREVGTHTSSAATALREAARDDVDVVLVSDLRGPDAVRAALDLVCSGVLVFATVRASAAAAAVEALVDAFPPAEQLAVRALLAESLAGIVAQQLVGTADGKSRVGVHEVLFATPAVVEAIRDAKTAELASIVNAERAQGMVTMDAALELLMSAGRITPESALERAVDKEAFARAVAHVRPDLAESLR